MKLTNINVPFTLCPFVAPVATSRKGASVEAIKKHARGTLVHWPSEKGGFGEVEKARI